MKKPNNFEATQGLTDFVPLTLGGHVCKIMSVEEKKTSTGKDMVVVSLDVAEGEEKGYYATQYKNDKRNPKQWGCVVNVVVEDKDGNTNRAFKQFIEAFEESNKCTVAWGDNFEQQFKDKLIGGVFGREQYKNSNQELKFATKCRWFDTVDKARKGINPPKDKLLEGVSQENTACFTPTTMEEDDDLPF